MSSEWSTGDQGTEGPKYEYQSDPDSTKSDIRIAFDQSFRFNQDWLIEGQAHMYAYVLAAALLALLITSESVRKRSVSVVLVGSKSCLIPTEHTAEVEVGENCSAIPVR
ncbi:hypothetical protein C8R44DRAFT_725785 [Mycena epipterygia]|nr:hypothetical protein C8R44DRAFT_725785 [Mycena epipterygia]